MLSWIDPLPFAPERVLVAGVTGSGKTTLARRLAVSWNLPYTDLDGLFHGENWTKRPTFEDDVDALTMHDRWITEWGYWGAGVKQQLGSRAQLVVWIDLPRRVALPRLIRRTVLRRLRRERLWNGNVEPPLHSFFTRPDENIIRWEMKTHDKWRMRMPTVLDEFPHLQIVRLGTPRDVEAWLAGPATRWPR